MAKEKVEIEILAQTKKSLANLAKFTAGVFAAVKSVQKIVRIAKESIDAYFKQEQAVTKLNAALKATGGIVGYTSGELQVAAKELSNLTGIADETIISAQALMTTFTQVGNEVFPQAIEAAADMSAMFGQDLQQSVVQLGTALNDPIAGVGRLRRIGISFTQEQKDSIKTFMDQNDIMSAQGVILDELAVEFGGVAKAVGESTKGAFDKLKNAYVDFQEESGHLIAVGLRPVAEWLTNVLNEAAQANKNIRLVNEALSGIAPAKNIDETRERIEALAAELENVAVRGALVYKMTKRQIDERTEAIKNEIANLKVALRYQTMGEEQRKELAAEERKIAEAAEAQAKAKIEFQKKLEEAYSSTEQGTQDALRAELAYWQEGVLPSLREGEDYAKVLAIITKLKKDMAKPETGGIDWERREKNMIEVARVERGLLESINEQGKKQEDVITDLDERWTAFGETLEGIATDSLVALSSAFGEALVAGEDVWEALGEAAKNAISTTLEAFAKQFAVEAIAALARLDPIGAAGFTAASIAAGVAAGAVSALAEGGIVMRPTVALMGERGPEAVIPLDRADNIGSTVNNYYNIRGSYISEKEMAARVAMYNARASRGY